MTRDLLKFLVMLGGIFALALGALRFFFVDVYVISGIGMIPTLTPGEQVFAWRDAKITQGDIAICAHPTQPGMLVVGRAFALGGRTVETERGEIRINGRSPTLDMQGEVSYTDPLTRRTERVRLVEESLDVDQTHLYIGPRGEAFRVRKTVVPVGKIYLLGDNRTRTTEDSRTFGPVLASSCRAQLFMRNGAVPGSPGPEHGYFDILR